MQPGKRPKPTLVKKLEDFRKSRINQNEPKPRPVAPTCPAWLSKVAKTEWRRIRPELEKLGLLTKIDRVALAAYCEEYSIWVKASQELQKHGLLIKTPSGHVYQSPYLSIVNTKLKNMKAFLVEFGMTPSARSRISVTPEESQDDDL